MSARFYTTGLATGCLNLLLLLQPAAAAEKGSLSYQGIFTWINGGSYQLVNDEHPLNPGNAPLQLPAFSLLSELRPDLRFTHPAIELVARPRIRFLHEWTSSVRGQATPTPHGAASGRLNEAFLQWTLSPHVIFAYGLQSYQWGPAEALSPSNRLFHESVRDRHALHEVQGKYLARLNFSLGEQLSLVLMGEYQAPDREQAVFQAEMPFASAGLVKGEYAWGGGANYVGLVVGGREHGHAWFGEYVNVELVHDSGVFLYGDAAHERGSQAYYPTAYTSSLPGDAAPDPSSSAAVSGMRLEASRRDEHKIYSLAALGLRYDHESGMVVRAEYLINEAGHTQAERLAAKTSLAQATRLPAAVTASQGARALAPGLELPGQRYAYASVFKPDLFAVTDLGATLRLLYSLTDQSFTSYFTFDYAIGDAGSVYIASSLNHGEATSSELGGLTSQSHMMGYRHVW